jgi:hypothetical protein
VAGLVHHTARDSARTTAYQGGDPATTTFWQPMDNHRGKHPPRTGGKNQIHALGTTRHHNHYRHMGRNGGRLEDRRDLYRITKSILTNSQRQTLMDKIPRRPNQLPPLHQGMWVTNTTRDWSDHFNHIHRADNEDVWANIYIRNP